MTTPEDPKVIEAFQKRQKEKAREAKAREAMEAMPEEEREEFAKFAAEEKARAEEDEKAKVLKAIPPIEPNNLVRGQFRGYRLEKGVAPDSNTETFAALELKVDSWRWKGVPFYIRAGKNLPVTCTEVVARFRKPPIVLRDDVSQNYIRFRISPEMTIALGANRSISLTGASHA